MRVKLILDNCGPDGVNAKNYQEQIVIFTMPPNCSSIHQPMNVGVFSTRKILYKSHMLQNIVRELWSRQKRRLKNAPSPADMKGISEGFELHLLDNTVSVKHTWNLVTKKSNRFLLATDKHYP